MIRTTALATFLALVGFSNSGWAQVEMKWEFKPGDVIYVEESSETRQKITVVTETIRYEGEGQLNGKLLRRLTVSGEGSWKPSSVSLPGVPRVVRANFPNIRPKSTVWYDPEKGRVAQVDTTLGINGSLTMRAGYQEGTATLEQTITVRHRVLDALPITDRATY